MVFEYPIETKSKSEAQIENQILDIKDLATKLLQGTESAKLNNITLGRSIHRLAEEIEGIEELFQSARQKKRNQVDNQTTLENSAETVSFIKNHLDEAFGKMQFLDNYFKNRGLQPEEKMTLIHESTNESDEKTQDDLTEALDVAINEIHLVKTELYKVPGT